MAAGEPLTLDVVIFGGGVAGLWLLGELERRGYRVLLLEAHDLGSGQTVASQGIIHGGLKYTLRGLFTRSANAITQMPDLWRQCLAGEREPRLNTTRVRSPFVYLWHTDSASSRAGMFGAKTMLSVKPTPLAPGDWPAALAGCRGGVYKLDEPVIDPASLVDDLAHPHEQRILKIDSQEGLIFDLEHPGQVRAMLLKHPAAHGHTLDLRPRVVVLAAGEGNADLRSRVGLSAQAMQRRPLHMVLARGGLPTFNGHCVDGSRTRVTITSDTDHQGRTVWQIGGQVAEDGVKMSPEQLIAHTRSELAGVMGKIKLENVQWSTYRVDRAEAATPDGARPENERVLVEGNVVTAWPTKLVLAPVLAERVLSQLSPPTGGGVTGIDDWPRPAVAKAPWETRTQWSKDV